MAATYPADTFQEGVDLTIEASNQLAQVVRGDANTEVTVADGSTIPSIRKAQVDSMYFKEPETWTSGQTETDYLQLKKYIDPTTNKESWWFAKSAMVSNPVAMGTSPFGDDNWTLYTPEDLFISGKAEYESVYQALKGKAAEAGFNLVDGSFEEGASISGWPDVVWCQTDGKYYQWHLDEAKTVAAGSTPATSGGIGAGAWIDRSDVVLRSELQSSGSGIDEIASLKKDIEGEILTTAQSWAGSGSYAGARRKHDIGTPGSSLPNQVYLSPVVFDGEFLPDQTPPSSGVVFSMGVAGLTSGAGFTQDAYGLKNIHVVGGTPEIVTFEPWTGHTAAVESVEIINNGSPSKWALNFKQQNWWPRISNNVFADTEDKGGNFCKAIDDEGDPALRYSGNSRVLFEGNRCKWLGLAVGGRMFYGSAVANRLVNNSAEGSSKPVTLGYPSAATQVEGLYTESHYGNQCVIQIGDDIASPDNVISFVSVRDVYNNMHSISSNKIFTVGNSSTVINHLAIDNVFVSNIPSTVVPVIAINDLPGQKIEVGRVDAGGLPLLPQVMYNFVNVLDMHGQGFECMNGDLAYSSIGSNTTVAGVYFEPAKAWKVKGNNPLSVHISLSGESQKSLKMARRVLSVFNPTSVDSVDIVYQHVNPVDIAGTDFVFQICAIANVATTANLTVEAWKVGTKTELVSKNINITGVLTEFSIYGFASQDQIAGYDVVVVRLRYTTTASTSITISAVRGNRGACGLCLPAGNIPVGKIKSILDNSTFVTP